MTSEAPALPKYNGRFLRVRNLEKYQHYKNRNPPWIKLHQLILEDYDFANLPDAAKWHAIAITLLASRTDNEFPFDPKWIGARINAKSRVDLEALVSISFLEVYGDASNVLASRKQNGVSEGEGEGEGEKRDIHAHSGFDEWWELYPRKVGKRDAEKAWSQTRKARPPNRILLRITRAHANTYLANGTSTRHIPHPATWLRGERWKDHLQREEEVMGMGGIEKRTTTWTPDYIYEEEAEADA